MTHYSTLGDAVRRSPLVNRLRPKPARLTTAEVGAIRHVARVTGADPVELIAGEVEHRFTVTE